jgi:hypothetical protein
MEYNGTLLYLKKNVMHKSTILLIKKPASDIRIVTKPRAPAQANKT